MNKHYIARLYRLHHELHKHIEGLAEDYAEDAEAFHGLSMICSELETIFAETLTEAERIEIQISGISEIFPDSIDTSDPANGH
jgi:hypothetical protein